MLAGQTSVGSNGYQNLLFPLEYMYLTQGEGGSGSHQGTYNMDFRGQGANGRVYHCPYYAPCDLRCTTVNPSGYLWTSLNPVNFVDGTVDYVTISFVHDDLSDFHVGDIKHQGELIGYTGTKGQVTGDHVHINVAKGENKHLYENSYGNWMLQSSYHIYNAMGINDTVIVVSGGYNWKEFTNSIIWKHKKFPWVLYAKKLREKHK